MYRILDDGVIKKKKKKKQTGKGNRDPGMCAVVREAVQPCLRGGEDFTRKMLSA